MMHEIKLYIINNPGICYEAIAAFHNTNLTTVYLAFKELNIPRGSKPNYYRG